MSTIQETSLEASLPKTLKALKIVLIVRLAIVAVFYVVFTLKDLTIGNVGPQIIMYTGMAFTVMLALIFFAIRKGNLWLLRTFIVIDLLAAIPASAFISIVLSLVALVLTFTKSFKAYFQG